MFFGGKTNSSLHLETQKIEKHILYVVEKIEGLWPAGICT